MQVPEDFDPTGYCYNYDEKINQMQDSLGVVAPAAAIPPRSSKSERPITPPLAQRKSKV